MINISRAISIVAVTALAAAAAIAIPPATQPGMAGSGATVRGENPTTQRNGSADQAFIDEAAKGGLGEVTLGRVAAQRAVNPQIKQFGEMMVDDHSKANAELLSLAMDRGMKPPTDMEAD